MTVDVELAPGVSLSDTERRRKAQAVIHHIKSLIGVTCEVAIKAEGEVPRSQGKAVRVKDERNKVQ
jgi:phenylacetate-CoA ligase